MKIKNWIIHKWKEFINYFLNNKNIIYRNLIIAAVAIFIFLLIDLLTKQFLFDENMIRVVKHENWLFGIRSVKNTGLTFFGNMPISIALVSFFNILILISCLISLIFFRHSLLIVAISLIFVGSLGNTIDRLAFGYVRDIFYLPWFDKGTFNLADVDVIFGSIMFVLTMLFITLKTN